MYGEGDAAKKQQPTGTTHDILKKAPLLWNITFILKMPLYVSPFNFGYAFLCFRSSPWNPLWVEGYNFSTPLKNNLSFKNF